MLHGLFEFAVRHEWCERNIIKLIEKKKIFEMEIKPLSISETKELLKTAKMKNNQSYSIAVGLLTFAGIRPKEVLRLKWQDIDLDENIITVRSQCSKTGGTRHVDICPSLKSLFKNFRLNEESYICPKNWPSQWKNIRDSSGFKGRWIPDVLRHTFASYHAKHFSDLSKLQLNMGHRDQSLLRSRYVNMCGISKSNAREFFNLCI